MIFNDKRIPDNELLIFARDLDVTTVTCVHFPLVSSPVTFISAWNFRGGIMLRDRVHLLFPEDNCALSWVIVLNQYLTQIFETEVQVSIIYYI